MDLQLSPALPAPACAADRWAQDAPLPLADPARAHDAQVERLLKPAEVAHVLGVSRTWLYDAARAGRVPAIRLGGPDGPLRFVEKDLSAWLNAARAAWRPGAPPART